MRLITTDYMSNCVVYVEQLRLIYFLAGFRLPSHLDELSRGVGLVTLRTRPKWSKRTWSASGQWELSQGASEEFGNLAKSDGKLKC